MITQHSIRSIIAPSIEALIKEEHHSSGTPSNPPITVRKELKSKSPLRFQYYRSLINKMYSSQPKAPKK